MISLEARKLVNTTNTVAAMHLHDGLTHLQSVDEIKSAIMGHFEAAQRAKTDEECMACIKILRVENDSLLEQFRTHLDDKESEGMFADSSMEIAQFLGFSRQQGLGAYNTVTLVGEVYGAYGLRLKPEAQRLWYWTKPDFFRKVSNTPRPVMAIKIAGWGIKANIAIDLLSIEPAGR